MTKINDMDFKWLFSKKKNGMTLTELLMASVLVGIVMLGVASFSVSLNQFQNSTDKSTLIAMKTKAAMARINRDALLAVGDATDPGVYSWTNGSNRNSICFRHDLANTPADYSDDTWTCYFHGNSFNVTRCVDPAAGPPPACTNNGQCCGGATEQSPLLQLADNASEYAAIVDADGDGRMDYIGITFTTRATWNQPAHPITNPEYTLTTQISPPGHSW